MRDSIYRASRIYTELFDSNSQSFKCLITEVFEVFEALYVLDFKEAAKECRQVLFELQMHLYHYTRLDFNLKFCNDVVDGFYARRKVWLKMFEEYDVLFKPSYLKNGSNHQRAYKIKLAFQLAGFNMSDEKAQKLKEKYSET
jgi:hypothetical protein